MGGNVKTSYSKFFIKSGRFTIQMDENKDVGSSQIGEQTLAQPHQLCLGNCRDSSDWSEYRGGYFSVDADQGDGVGSALRLAAAERERGDIDAELAKSCPNLSNNSRLIAVPQVKNRAFELGLQRNSFDLQHARRPVMENRSFSRETSRRSGSFGQCGDFQSVRKPVLAPASLFFHGQTSRRSHRR